MSQVDKYYSVIIKKKNSNKNGDPKSIYAFDFDREKMINEVCIPYIENKQFFVNGYVLEKNEIVQIKIVTTKERISILADKETEALSRNGILGFFREEDIVNSNKYTNDVTTELLNIEKLRTNKSNKLDSNSIFIVHGHDINKLNEVQLFLNKIDLSPVVLGQKANEGNTIIEKFEKYAAQVSYAIILYTACDIGAEKGNEKNLELRARQNVVFEHGYFTHALGRNRVAVLLEKGVEKPSDIDGILYIPLDCEGAWKFKLAREMKKTGLLIDLNKID
ncbi:MAG: nucleotide-binding protein [Clostridia bacterium]|nr:nucleotide-binding protein [Clostridia bacterium]